MRKIGQRHGKGVRNRKRSRRVVLLGETYEERQIGTKKGRAVVTALPFFNPVVCLRGSYYSTLVKGFFKDFARFVTSGLYVNINRAIRAFLRIHRIMMKMYPH